MIKKFNNLSNTAQKLIIIAVCSVLGVAIVLGCYIAGNKNNANKQEYNNYFLTELINGAGKSNEKIETVGYVSYINKEESYFIISDDKSKSNNTEVYCYVSDNGIMSCFKINDPVVIKGTYIKSKDGKMSVKVIYAVCYDQTEVTLTGTIKEKNTLYFLFEAEDVGYRSIGAIQCLPAGTFQANVVNKLNVGDKVTITGKLTNSNSLTDFSFEINEISPAPEVAE